jgi:predicted acyltransferase
MGFKTKRGLFCGRHWSGRPGVGQPEVIQYASGATDSLNHDLAEDRFLLFCLNSVPWHALVRWFCFLYRVRDSSLMSDLNSAMPDRSVPSQPDLAQTRLLSLDALRGFDMFWIVGAEELVRGLQKFSQGGLLGLVAEQLHHKAWAGFHFEDLIFPLFVFIAGVSLVFSLDKALRQTDRRAVTWRILRRAALLYFIGILYYGGFSTTFEKIRLLGVLQRISLCYLFAGLLYCHLKPRTLVAVFVSILVGYWGLMSFVPVPGFGAGNFAEGANLANYVDQQYLPLRKHDGDHDPEGLLSTLPAVASCLLGELAGMCLKQSGTTDRRKVLQLVAAGAACLAAGWVWHLNFPVVKKLWTSSFVLVAGGYSCWFLAAFYQIVDVWKIRKWAMPFVWIGVNPIMIYFGGHFIDFEAMAKLFVGGPVAAACGPYADLVLAVTTLGFGFWFLRFLYQRRIFLRV